MMKSVIIFDKKNLKMSKKGERNIIKRQKEMDLMNIFLFQKKKKKIN